MQELQEMLAKYPEDELMESLAEALAKLSERNPEAIRPNTVRLATAAFVACANAGYVLDEDLYGRIDGLDPDVFGQVLMQSLGQSPDQLDVFDKMKAVRVAEEIGPDWAQKLYRFAVLCTKLA